MTLHEIIRNGGNLVDLAVLRLFLGSRRLFWTDSATPALWLAARRQFNSGTRKSTSPKRSVALEVPDLF
jgi:hypothetical protein